MIAAKKYVIGGAASIVLIAILWLCISIYGAKKWNAGYAQAQAEYNQAANTALIKAREEDQRRINEHKGIADEAKKQLEIARNDVIAANSVSRRLREQINAIRANSTTDSPTTTFGSEASADSVGLLAELFSKSDERAGELAQVADEARVRGLACEQAYDALVKIE